MSQVCRANCLQSVEYSRRSTARHSWLSILRPINRETQRIFRIFMWHSMHLLERASIMSTCACWTCKEFPLGVVRFSVRGRASTRGKRLTSRTVRLLWAINKSPSWSFADAARIPVQLRNSEDLREHVKVNAVEGGQGREEKGRVILEWCVE